LPYWQNPAHEVLPRHSATIFSQAGAQASSEDIVPLDADLILEGLL
jgi:hypothetical protein